MSPDAPQPAVLPRTDGRTSRQPTRTEALGALAVVTVVWQAFPIIRADLPRISEAIEYFSEGYIVGGSVGWYFLTWGWHTVCVAAATGWFIWVHAGWSAETTKRACRVLGAVVAVASTAAGALVLAASPPDPEKLWYVWSTYGHHLLWAMGLILLSFRSRNATLVAGALAAASGWTLLSLPPSLLFAHVGYIAALSLGAYTWVLGMCLPSRSATGVLLRVLPLGLLSFDVTPWVFPRPAIFAVLAGTLWIAGANLPNRNLLRLLSCLPLLCFLFYFVGWLHSELAVFAALVLTEVRVLSAALDRGTRGV